MDFYLIDKLATVRDITEESLDEYNTIRPHDSLGGRTPHP